MDAPYYRDVEHLFSEGVTNHLSPPGDETCCPLCQETYASDESELIVITKSCVRPHAFHAKCLLTWLRVHHNNTCPTCRNQLYGTQIRGESTHPLRPIVDAMISAQGLDVAMGLPPPYTQHLPIARVAAAFRAGADACDRLFEEHTRRMDAMMQANTNVQSARVARVIAQEKVKSIRQRNPHAAAHLRAAEEELQMYTEIQDKFQDDYEKAVEETERVLAELCAAREHYEDARDEFIRLRDEEYYGELYH
ncbi:uncharacterized protein EI97DRAFT_458805 [Westerdykella ornata]|uniref:RING-type domain-containing protein n=1 Tax=Westerdykella ornata TaxID=318751 RepID=A0A6A6JGL8_WESOR|nr:uncharacterized protein EI97DRAFT_458805 [Westerdykella ornata]KAF2275790.1 hypothetical protein EI97DRAFT_458805 [Westerdykella ornata]